MVSGRRRDLLPSTATARPATSGRPRLIQNPERQRGRRPRCCAVCNRRRLLYSFRRRYAPRLRQGPLLFKSVAGSAPDARRRRVTHRVAEAAPNHGHLELLTPSISPDGKWIAYASAGGHIFKLPIEGGAPIQVTSSSASEFSPAWSPDGKRIAFGSSEGGAHTVWVVDADGANRRQFAKAQLNDWNFNNVVWSPGSNILYHGPRWSVNILDPDTGKEKPLIRNESLDVLAMGIHPTGLRWRGLEPAAATRHLGNFPGRQFGDISLRLASVPRSDGRRTEAPYTRPVRIKKWCRYPRAPMGVALRTPFLRPRRMWVPPA